jgi:hypothetical protein
MRISKRVPLFCTLVVVFVGVEEWDNYIKESSKTLLKHGMETDFPELVNQRGNCCGSYIWLKGNNLGVFSHEIAHFVSDLMSHVGTECEEVRAHVTEWAFTDLLEKVNKYQTPEAT